MTNIYDDVVRNNIKKIIKQKGYKQWGFKFHFVFLLMYNVHILHLE